MLLAKHAKCWRVPWPVSGNGWLVAVLRVCLRPWPCRLLVQALPAILAGGIIVVMTATRAMQLVQTHVLHVLPFGSLGQFSVLDVCTGILVSGLFMMYFGGCGVKQTPRATCPCVRLRLALWHCTLHDRSNART
jgi:hypothetical protein